MECQPRHSVVGERNGSHPAAVSCSAARRCGGGWAPYGTRLQQGRDRTGLCLLRHRRRRVRAEIVLDIDTALGFLDHTPLFKGHVLVVPRVHVVTLPDLDPVGPFFEAVQRVAAALPGR